MTSVYPHTKSVGLVVCAPCAAGRSNRLGGIGAPESCEVCPPGSSAPPGATACVDCPAGRFNGYEILECASCQPGFFNFVTGQTMCQECAAGRHASTENQTACDDVRRVPFSLRRMSCGRALAVELFTPAPAVLLLQSRGCAHIAPAFEQWFERVAPASVGALQSAYGRALCSRAAAVAAAVPGFDFELCPDETETEGQGQLRSRCQVFLARRASGAQHASLPTPSGGRAGDR